MYNGFDFGKTEIFFRSGLDKAKAPGVPDLPVGQNRIDLLQQITGNPGRDFSHVRHSVARCKKIV
jgi:hypothetical protein